MQIDCGNARAGVWWEDDEAVEIVKYLQSQGNVKFQGTDLCGFQTDIPTYILRHLYSLRKLLRC